VSPPHTPYEPPRSSSPVVESESLKDRLDVDPVVALELGECEAGDGGQHLHDGDWSGEYGFVDQDRCVVGIFMPRRGENRDGLLAVLSVNLILT
jgi:hypothetical protein